MSTTVSWRAFDGLVSWQGEVIDCHLLYKQNVMCRIRKFRWDFIDFLDLAQSIQTLDKKRKRRYRFFLVSTEDDVSELLAFNFSGSPKKLIS